MINISESEQKDIQELYVKLSEQEKDIFMKWLISIAYDVVSDALDCEYNSKYIESTYSESFQEGYCIAYDIALDALEHLAKMSADEANRI